MKIYIIIGTRPDAIKMAPVYHALKAKKNVCVTLISTGQHKEILASVLQSFHLKPDIDLNVMVASQSLSELTQAILQKMEGIFKHQRPELVLTHGDTVTCFASSLASFYHHIPVYHIEAGLRSHDISSPYPEEYYRKAVALLATHHFTPTIREKLNLMKEGVNESNITVIGNTIHEAIQSMDYHTLENNTYLYDKKMEKMVLVTLHRREKNKDLLQSIIKAIKNVALKAKHCLFIYPVHPNPITKKIIHEILQDVKNIILTDPMDYKQFIQLLYSSDLILTDSGGVQEEAAFLGKNVFILRNDTERMDGIHEKQAKVIGLNSNKIESEVFNYLHYGKPAEFKSSHHKGFCQKPSALISDFIVSEFA